MNNNKPLPREHVSVSLDDPSTFLEIAAMSVQSNQDTKWIFGSCSFENLIGNHDVPIENRLLRSALVIFSQDVFSRYVHARMFENIFETNEVYNSFWYKKETFYPKVYAILSADEHLAIKANEIIKKAEEDMQVSLLSKKVQLEYFEASKELQKETSVIVSHKEFMQIVLKCTIRECKRFFFF